MQTETIASYSVSVRELAEYCMMSGSIDNRYTGRGRMNEGVKLHKYIQKNYGADDISEYTVKTSVMSSDGIELNVGGRIDGVLSYKKNPVIEEIKSTARDPEEFTHALEVHLAQCRVYAYIYATQNKLDKIGLKITYIHNVSKNIKNFDFTETCEELKAFFVRLTSEYFDFLRMKMKYEAERNVSVESMKFPFAYRQYQKNVIDAINSVIDSSKNVFMNAPTGTGKTIDTLYPSIKKLPELSGGKIFYLTAKSTQKDVATHTLNLLYKRGLKMKSVVITSKEKSCMLETPACNPDDCPYAKGYYDKIKDVLNKVAAENDLITRDIIMKYAEENKVCPFELGLDLSVMADVIVCDYNYVFDPSAALKRFFETETKADFIFLVDEAHNLTDRSREMYSATLSKDTVLKIRRLFKTVPKIYEALGRINNLLLQMSKSVNEQGVYIAEGLDAQLVAELWLFQYEADKFLSRADRRDEAYKELLDFYFDTISFINISEIMTDAHTVYYDANENFLRLYCTDAREYLRERIQKGRSAVFFSATLTPLDYYCELLGGSRDDFTMSVGSIFPQDNFKIAVDRSILTTYEKRDMYYSAAADRIHRTISHEEGNYIVYFPSYAYMNAVYMAYCDKFDGSEILMQTRNMSEAEREEFLARFSEGTPVCAFAVAGGVFAEAIDLTGDKLIGCIICGVSLPMICTERDLIKTHYDSLGRNGFDYAYVYPAMNKVLQAMGRVIRTVDDRGCAVLLDARFTYTAYRKCFPPYYSHMAVISGGEQLDGFFNYEGDWGC